MQFDSKVPKIMRCTLSWPSPTPSCIRTPPVVPQDLPAFNRSVAVEMASAFCAQLYVTGQPFQQVPNASPATYTILTRNFNLNTSQPATDLKLWFTISLIEAIDCVDGFQLDLATYNDIFATLCGDSCLVSIDDVSYGGSVIHGCWKYDVRTSNSSADIPPTVSFNSVG
jgi:hypothetical protein